MYKSQVISAVASLVLATGFSPEVVNAEEGEADIKSSISLVGVSKNNYSKMNDRSTLKTGNEDLKITPGKIKSVT